MRDLQSDWQKWTLLERFFGVLTMIAFFLAATLPFLK